MRVSEWGLTFSKMKLIRGMNGNLFVCSPSYRADKNDPKSEYKPYWSFDKEKSRRFTDNVLKVIEEFIKTNYSDPLPKQELKLDKELPF